MAKMSLGKTQWTLFPVIFSLAWPTMLEQLLQTAVQYIDTAMVGTLGTHATAAVGATSTVNWLIGSTVSALAIGFLAYIAQAYGAGKKEEAKKASSQAVLAVIFSGLLFTALTLGFSNKVPVWMQVDTNIQSLASRYFFIVYSPMLFRAATIIFGTMLRSVGDSKTPMRIGVLVNFINIILNFILIYPTRTVNTFGTSIKFLGAGWGVEGAAAASAVSYVVGGILITIAVWKHPEVSPRGVSLKPNWAVLKPCLRVAIPNMFQRFGTSLGYVAFASLINSIGEVATAAHTIANTVESAFYIPAYGMQTAAATLSGNALGAGDRKRMKDISKLLMIIETVLMVVSGGLLFIFAPNMMRLFTDNPEVIRLGTTVLKMVALSEPIYGIAIIMEGLMQGTGNTITPFIYNLIGMWGIRIVGTFILTQIFSYGLISAWGCMIFHNLIVFFMFLISYLRGRWNPLLREGLKT